MSIFGKIMGAIFGYKDCVASDDSVRDICAEDILDAMAEAKGDNDLNWRTSVVDLMKVLDLDSGHNARKKLAKELGYDGDTKDSSEMNDWLHERLMAKLACEL